MIIYFTVGVISWFVLLTWLWKEMDPSDLGDILSFWMIILLLMPFCIAAWPLMSFAYFMTKLLQRWVK